MKWWRFAAMASVLAGCTLITNETSSQCHSQEDCISRGPEFANTTCAEDRTCQPIKAAVEACTSNKQCADQNGGAPFICRKSDSRCVSLLSTVCQTIYADKVDLLDDNLVIMGATTPSDDNGRQTGFALDLGRQEIKRLGGLAPATPGGPHRPLGILRCDGEGNDVTTARAIATYLTDAVQVPFVSGPFAGAFSLLETQQYVARGVLSVTQVPLIDITSADSKGLAYRITNSDAQNIKALTPLIRDIIIPQARANGTLGPTEALRLAVMATDDPPGQSTLAEITKTVTYNDNGSGGLLSVADNQTNGNFAVFNIGNPQDPVGNPSPEASRNAAVAKALDYKPHFVIFNGVPIPPFFVGGDMGWLAINRGWPAGQPLPYTLTLNQGFATIMVGFMSQFASAGPARQAEARSKFFGLRGQALNFNGKDFGFWVQGLKTTFPELTGAVVTPLAAMSYNRVYLFAYAAAAIGNSPINGTTIAGGLRRAAGTGTPIQWGPTDYPKAIAELTAGKEIQFTGPDGLVQFNERGDRLGLADVYCIQAKQGSGAILGALSTGYTVDPANGASKGTPTCPDAP